MFVVMLVFYIYKCMYLINTKYYLFIILVPFYNDSSFKIHTAIRFLFERKNTCSLLCWCSFYIKKCIYLYIALVPFWNDPSLKMYGLADSLVNTSSGCFIILVLDIPRGSKSFDLTRDSHDLPPIFSATWPNNIYIWLLYWNRSRNGKPSGKSFINLWKWNNKCLHKVFSISKLVWSMKKNAQLNFPYVYMGHGFSTVNCSSILHSFKTLHHKP